MSQPQPPSDSLSKTSAPIHHTQVAPQHSPKTATSKSKETASDPHHVKSPLSGTNPSHSNNNNNSRPASRTGSFKGPFKSGGGGLISLLLCCTFGAGSLLDNSDKSAFFSRHRKKNNNRHSTSADTHSPVVEKNNISPSSSPSPPTSAPALPKIFTHPTDLAHFSSSAAATSSSPTDQQEDPPVTSATPCSIPPQSPDGQIMWLLPPLATDHIGRKCLVLDLDETLVHSSFKVIPNPDFIVPVEIDNQYHNVYVLKRPGVDEFMRRMGQVYEIVVFTASLSKYADPVLDMLDIHKVVTHRLFRESCYNHKGTYVKDLSQLGRELTQTLILDNSPASYIFHTSNAVPVSTWFSDPHDTELSDLIAFLEDLTTVDDVTMVLDSNIDASLPVR
ncbi:hypothetical protein LRAMOSA05404 [Lichtheimia ramosa]|uniref:FCP1 homology domain-containing protein n=1 Tax=Lichtheimia ramosa TaxID=688394 RepID=A0A077X050_9FUNG|nr:hypothetical protein LRAMOSA05404 [Lichtheimia ramosa]